jgi:uncharacterized membrane protein YsdA (DUF1294 family)
MRAAAWPVLALALVAGSARAANTCEQRAHEHRVAGTVLGAIGGAVIGNQVSHHGGALVGGVGGAVVGNQLARSKCYERPAQREAAAGRSRAAPGPAPVAGACHFEDQPFYNERGDLVHRQVQVCQ